MVTKRPVVDLFKHTDASRYQIQGYLIYDIVLGFGANGTVYLGAKGPCQVAIKCTKRTRQPEVEILSKLSHSNLQTLLDFIPLPSGSIAILELYTGGDLFAYLEQHGALTEREVSFFAWQLIKGIRFLHDKRIAHRDVKPENIILANCSTFTRIVLVDFGEAATLETMRNDMSSMAQEADGSIMRPYYNFGTTSYISPEMLQPDSAIYTGSQRAVCKQWLDHFKGSDAWALACKSPREKD